MAAVPIVPGATIGILGAGQLGRMLALAAARLGLKAHIFSPGTGPAHDVAAARTLADYADIAALAAFAEKVVVVTYEFENVPAPTAEFLAARRPVRPGAMALSICQDRLTEKRFLESLSIATAPFAAVDDANDLAAALGKLGSPAILKGRRQGYDGKGQLHVAAGDDLAAAFAAIGGGPSVLEGVVPFRREISVVAARGLDGGFIAYDVAENEHEHHVLSRTLLPARVADATAAEAIRLAQSVAVALDYVGVLAVEFFVLGDAGAGEGERLVVNEIAPRVHNSGHWTIDGAATSQFEQHVRAICGWPLGSPHRCGPVVMKNLLGDEVGRWREILAEPGARLHLYGKSAARPGRKMGHVTRLGPPDES